MSKFKTGKLLAVSLLSVFAAQAIAEDAAENTSPVTENAPVASQPQGSRWVDFSDPTAIYSKMGLATGTEGVDIYAALGGYLGGRFEQKLTVEAIHDMDYYNVNYLAFNTSNDTGFSIKTTWNNNDDYGEDYEEASVGVIKKLGFTNKAVKFYPAMNAGVMWDWDDSIPTTTFVEIDAAVRYTVTPDFWVGVTPTYRYALNGLDIDNLDGTAEAGYQLAQEVAISIHVNNDDEVWGDFTFAF